MNSAEEQEANYFAMCLLIPEDMLRQDLKKLDGVDLADDDWLEHLSKRYAVSMGLMVLRLNDLGMFKGKL